MSRLWRIIFRAASEVRVGDVLIASNSSSVRVERVTSVVLRGEVCMKEAATSELARISQDTARVSLENCWDRYWSIYTEQMDAAVLGDGLPEVTHKPFLGPKSLSLQYRH